MHMCQHTIFVCVLKWTQLAFIIFTTPVVIYFNTEQTVITKPADKGSATFIMDKSPYANVGLRQLSDLHLVKHYRVNLHMPDILNRGQITEDTCKYLTTYTDRTQLIYMLPKIDEGLINLPGRLLVSQMVALQKKILICRSFYQFPCIPNKILC